MGGRERDQPGRKQGWLGGREGGWEAELAGGRSWGLAGGDGWGGGQREAELVAGGRERGWLGEIGGVGGGDQQERGWPGELRRRRELATGSSAGRGCSGAGRGRSGGGTSQQEVELAVGRGVGYRGAGCRRSGEEGENWPPEAGLAVGAAGLAGKDREEKWGRTNRPARRRWGKERISRWGAGLTRVVQITGHSHPSHSPGEARVSPAAAPPCV